MPIAQGRTARCAGKPRWSCRRSSRRHWKPAWRLPPISKPSVRRSIGIGSNDWSAPYQVDRAHRQYAAVDPENRLVARTLERLGEALAAQARLAAEYERPARTSATPSPAECAAIRTLTQDVPALWHAATTTGGATDHRAAVARAGLVTVVDGSEQVQVECHWHRRESDGPHVDPAGRTGEDAQHLRRTGARATGQHGQVTAAPRSQRCSIGKAGAQPSDATRSTRRWCDALLTTAGMVDPSPRRTRVIPSVEPG